MSKVPFSMINRKTSDNSGQLITLEGIYENSPEGLMYVFSGGDYTKQKVLDAIEHLKQIGGGSFYIPENGHIKRTKIEVYKEFGVYHTRFIYYDFTYPQGLQARPYLETEWEAGDMVYNQDLSNDYDNVVWVCMSSGIPGTWVRNDLDRILIRATVEAYNLEASNKYPGYPYKFRYVLSACKPEYYVCSYTSDWDLEFLTETGDGYIDFFFTHEFEDTVAIGVVLFNTTHTGYIVVNPDSSVNTNVTTITVQIPSASIESSNTYKGYDYVYKYPYLDSTQDLYIVSYAVDSDYDKSMLLETLDGKIYFYFERDDVPDGLEITLTLFNTRKTYGGPVS